MPRKSNPLQRRFHAHRPQGTPTFRAFENHESSRQRQDASGNQHDQTAGYHASNQCPGANENDNRPSDDPGSPPALVNVALHVQSRLLVEPPANTAPNASRKTIVHRNGPLGESIFNQAGQISHNKAPEPRNT